MIRNPDSMLAVCTLLCMTTKMNKLILLPMFDAASQPWKQRDYSFLWYSAFIPYPFPKSCTETSIIHAFNQKYKRKREPIENRIWMEFSIIIIEIFPINHPGISVDDCQVDGSTRAVKTNGSNARVHMENNYSVIFSSLPNEQTTGSTE